MKNSLINGFANILKIAPIALLKMVNKRPLISIFYHAVSNQPMPHVDTIYPSISADQFEAELLYLKSIYSFVTYQQVADFYERDIPLPENALYLSFDDGFIECYSVVLPIIEKLLIPCTFFVTTDWIDNNSMFFRNKMAILWNIFLSSSDETKYKMYIDVGRILGVAINSKETMRKSIFSLREHRNEEIESLSQYFEFDEKEYLKNNPLYVTTSQLEEMVSKGYTLGAHTQSHPKLEQVSFDRMESEISQSCKIIQEISGEKSVPFAFPNSATNIDRNELNSIYTKHTHVGLLFNTKGVLQDEDFIVNRIWAEKKLPNVNISERLPVLIKKAFIESTVEEVRRNFR